MLLHHLAQVERHVIEGIGHIERQKQRIVDLECRGHDSKEARALLTQLRELQQIHEAQRSQLHYKRSGITSPALRRLVPFLDPPHS